MFHFYVKYILISYEHMLFSVWPTVQLQKKEYCCMVLIEGVWWDFNCIFGIISLLVVCFLHAHSNKENKKKIKEFHLLHFLSSSHFWRRKNAHSLCCSIFRSEWTLKMSKFPIFCCKNHKWIHAINKHTQ